MAVPLSRATPCSSLIPSTSYFPSASYSSSSCIFTLKVSRPCLTSSGTLHSVRSRHHGGERVVVSSASSPQGATDLSQEDDEEVGEDVVPAPPPTAGRINIMVTKDLIRRLDLSPAHDVLRRYVHQIGDNTTSPLYDPKELFEQTVGFVLDYERDDPLDPRELSEMPDIRLWFVRLDSAYPWLPVVMDWRAGELSRYAAMLVPHQMSKRLGLVFNPEALELFAMNKLFLIHEWLKAHDVVKPESKLNDMMRMLGFSISDQLYSLIAKSPHPETPQNTSGSIFVESVESVESAEV